MRSQLRRRTHSDNKLVPFHRHFETLTEEEGEDVPMQDLVRWYYEDAVKIKYTTFISILEVCQRGEGRWEYVMEESAEREDIR